MTSLTLCSLPATALPMCVAGSLCRSSVGEKGVSLGEGVWSLSLLLVVLERLISLGGRESMSNARCELTCVYGEGGTI